MEVVKDNIEQCNPKVYVVMRNHNAFDLTYCCLSSLADCSYQNLHIVVIDDGSKDDSGDRISAEFPSLTVIKSAEYIEYCRGLNVGLRHALSNDADFVFVVNNDTANFTTNYFEALVAAFSTDETIGMVGSLVYDFDGNRRSAGTAQTRLGVFVDTPTEGYMFSSKVLREVGLFDEVLVRYFEDFDYLIRMRNQGFRSLCVKSVSFDHLGGGTSKNQLFVPNYYRVRNLIWFIKRYQKDKSVAWKLINFRGFMKKHIMLSINHLQKGRLVKASCVILSVWAGLIVGLALNWSNENYD